MTGNETVGSLLHEVMASGPTVAPYRLLPAIRAGVDRTPQRRRRWPLAPDVTAGRSRPRLWPGGVAVIAGGLALALAAVALSPRVPSGPGTSPSGWPSSASPNQSMGIELVPTQLPYGEAYIEQSGELVPGTTPGGTLYTSWAFAPTITFRVACRQIDMSGVPCELGDRGAELCGYATDSHAIVLGREPGCRPAVRIIRPYAVDCGTAGPHPRADELADAILHDRLAGVARDAGTLATARTPIPGGFFGATYLGRVIEIEGAGRPPEATADPGRGHCWIVPEPDTRPGFAEIRADESAVLVLLDVHGQLVVIIVESPGTAGGAQPGDLAHLLLLLHDIRFE